MGIEPTSREVVRVIRDHPTGLLPGQTTVYLFNAEIKTGDNGCSCYLCYHWTTLIITASDRTDPKYAKP